MGDTTETGDLYSPAMGFLFVFNLIVGTGALTMPKAFAEAGWIISLVLICILACMSYVTTTFVIEAMAAANAMIRWKKREKKRELDESDTSSSDSSSGGNSSSVGSGGNSSSVGGSYESFESQVEERKALLPKTSVNRYNYTVSPPPDETSKRHKNKKTDYFDITKRVEMGKMASLFFNKIGINLFYITIIVYLYGDLAIYATSVPKSLAKVACTLPDEKSCGKKSNLTTDLCWPSLKLDTYSAYRIFLTVFVFLLGPFVFFNLQKTKVLQIVTSAMRWFAFLSMISLALVHISHSSTKPQPKRADFSGVPNFFGVCVYSFMCQHSLPSMITPIDRKTHLSRSLAANFALILGFYLLLSFTAIYTFDADQICDLYTLNFHDLGVSLYPFFKYYLELFPVFTLSTNFPIIAITLRNNLRSLFSRDDRTYHWTVERLAFPLLALVPPVVVAYFTQDVEFLVGITGSYAGAGVQYLVPAFLVFCGRRETQKIFGKRCGNKHASPFRHLAWVLFVLCWAITCIVVVTVNHIINRK